MWSDSIVIISLVFILNQSPLIRHIQAEIACGVSSKVEGLVYRGEELQHGKFPWIAALFVRRVNKQPSYICGGTLISQNQVVTAAHCIYRKGSIRPMPHQALTVILGAHNLSNFLEPGRVSFLVEMVKIHEKWNPTSNRFSDDIAIVKLNENANFGHFIRPVCVDHIKTEDLEVGSIVGWGLTTNDHVRSPTAARLVKVPIIPNEKCYRYDYRLAQAAGEKTFCGGRSGFGVCSGDSGSGLYIKQNNRYYLKGIVSAAISGGACNGNFLAIFTDVIEYLSYFEIQKIPSSSSAHTVIRTIENTKYPAISGSCC